MQYRLDTGSRDKVANHQNAVQCPNNTRFRKFEGFSSTFIPLYASLLSVLSFIAPAIFLPTS